MSNSNSAHRLVPHRYKEIRSEDSKPNFRKTPAVLLQEQTFGMFAEKQTPVDVCAASDDTLGHIARRKDVFMLLSREQITERNIVANVEPKSMREASYDLRVRTILAKPFDSKKEAISVVSVEEYELPPQGMVEVISEEKLTLPDNVLGYATVKTNLSDRCVLALGIGLIDPGYDSYISSTLVNFGTQPFHLKRGSVFLRVTFHEYTHSGAKPKEVHMDLLEYSQAKRDKVLSRFSRTFLNLGNTVNEAADLLWRKVWPRVLELSAVAALIVAISTAIGTIGISILGSRFISAPDSEVQEMRSNYSKLQEQYAATQKELQDLRQGQKELQSLIGSEHQKKK